MTEEIFVCSICGRNNFKHNMALKAHERWHNPHYKENISKKVKAKWQDPDYKENMSKKMKAIWQNVNTNSISNNKSIEVIKFNNNHLEFFEIYSKAQYNFDEISIVNDYIKNKFNGNRIQPNIKENIKQSFNMIIKNNLKIGVIEVLPIYRRNKG